MEVLFELESNGKKKIIRLAANCVGNLLNEFGSFQAAAMSECHISLLDGEEKKMECHVEICGMTPELLLKVTRFFFYEKAWEILQTLTPHLSAYAEHKEGQLPLNDLGILNQVCLVVMAGTPISETMLDKNADYLQSLEDSIRCGQVMFKDHLTDTNVNRERLATVLVAGMFESAKTNQEIQSLVDLIQVVAPEYTYEGTNTELALCAGLESMIGYVNSICD